MVMINKLEEGITLQSIFDIISPKCENAAVVKRKITSKKNYKWLRNSVQVFKMWVALFEGVP